MGVKISNLPTATEAEAASGLIPVVTDPNGDGNLVTKHITGSSIVGSGASVNTSATPPSNPSNGDLWFDEENAELYIYNTSINGWIQTNGGGGSGGGSTSTGIGITGNISLLKFENAKGWNPSPGWSYSGKLANFTASTSYTVDPAKTYRCIGVDRSLDFHDSSPIPVVTDTSLTYMSNSVLIFNSEYDTVATMNFHLWIYIDKMHMFITTNDYFNNPQPATNVLIMESDS